LYVAIQRMLANGAKRVSSVRLGTAGVDRTLVDATSQLKAGDENAPSTQYAMYAGIYDSSNALIAMERGVSEEDIGLIDEPSLAGAFGELKWARIGVGVRTTSLIQEIWRWFVLVMLAALLLEAALCLPRLRRPSTGTLRSTPVAK
jgi:hypothetical protein